MLLLFFNEGSHRAVQTAHPEVKAVVRSMLARQNSKTHKEKQNAKSHKQKSQTIEFSVIQYDSKLFNYNFQLLRRFVFCFSGG